MLLFLSLLNDLLIYLQHYIRVFESASCVCEYELHEIYWFNCCWTDKSIEYILLTNQFQLSVEKPTYTLYFDRPTHRPQFIYLYRLFAFLFDAFSFCLSTSHQIVSFVFYMIVQIQLAGLSSRIYTVIFPNVKKSVEIKGKWKFIEYSTFIPKSLCLGWRDFFAFAKLRENFVRQLWLHRFVSHNFYNLAFRIGKTSMQYTFLAEKWT